MSHNCLVFLNHVRTRTVPVNYKQKPFNYVVFRKEQSIFFNNCIVRYSVNVGRYTGCRSVSYRMLEEEELVRYTINSDSVTILER